MANLGWWHVQRHRASRDLSAVKKFFIDTFHPPSKVGKLCERNRAGRKSCITTSGFSSGESYVCKFSAHSDVEQLEHQSSRFAVLQS
jgi:hypothetical protein